jgi:hypothetical protein
MWEIDFENARVRLLSYILCQTPQQCQVWSTPKVCLSRSRSAPQLISVGPSYISSHSADVILSDIRPTKLKPDALRAINILLDEFLYKMLSISASLATDKLRASLLGLLPTNLGKEALLEAEVELRAYWERTESRVPTEDDSRSFHLQWAFEVRFIILWHLSDLHFSPSLAITLKVRGIFDIE